MDPEIPPQTIDEVLTFPCMNPTAKRHIISAVVTFVATFLTVFGANLFLADAMALTGSIVAGIAITASRAATKAVFESLGLSNSLK